MRQGISRLRLEPRLVLPAAFVYSSAGADWALIDIFLPSSSEITIHNGIQKPETVHEIIITEEEYDSFLPS